MKNIFLLFLLSSVILTNAQENNFCLKEHQIINSNRSINTTNWTSAEQVSSIPNEDSHYARMVIDSDNTLHLVYSDDRPDLAPYGQKIIYKKKPEGGVWTEDLIVCEFDGTTVNNHYPDIAVAENGDVHIVFRHTVIGAPEYISHSFYDASEDQWSQSNIATNNTIAMYPYPEVACTHDSRPIAAWADDELDGTNPNAYFSYFDGSNWSSQVLLGRDDDEKSHSVRITSLGNQTSMICFAEVSVDGNYDELFYQIFDETTNTLSEIKAIPTIDIEQNTYLFNYSLAKSTTENMAVLAYNVKDTIYTLHYDIANDIFSETGEYAETDGGAYILQKRLDIVCDNNGVFHIPFAQNNYWGLYYVDYSTTTGFGNVETLNTYSNQDAPSIVCDNNNRLHMVFCDDRDDSNGDQYMDREVYYTSLDLSTQINTQTPEESTFSIYPNPATDQLTINNSQLTIKKIQIIDLTGKAIQQIESQNSIIRINISDLEQNIYFLKIGKQTRKFIKE